MRIRADLLAHSQPTNRPWHLPEIGQQLADTANRDGVVARFPAAAVQKRLAVDLALMGHDDPLRGAVEVSLRNTAQPHHAHTRYLRRTVPGIGAILRLGLRDESQDIGRFPRVQDVVSYGRLVKGTKEVAGKRDGTSGTRMGHAERTWAFSDAAGLLLRDHPAGQQQLTKREKTQGTGKALTMLAPKLGRAVSDL